MRIQEIRVEGYRSLKNVVWKPDALNVLIGPNGGGKTNLIKALEFLSVCGRGDVLEYVQREGGMQSLLWDGKLDGRLLFLVETETLAGTNGILGMVKTKGTFRYGILVTPLGAGPYYAVQEERLQIVPDGQEGPIPLVEGKWLQSASILNELDGTTISKDIKEFSLPKTLISTVNPWTSPTADRFRSALASWGIYQEFFTGRFAAVRQPAITRYEKRVAADGENLIAVLHTLYNENEMFREEIDAAMQAVFGDAFKEIRFSPAADKYIQMKVRWRHLKNPIPSGDLSDGTLRFLFLITILANPDPPPLIVIEEPEIGLHPRMMAVVAEFAAQAAERSQVIFTTHSPEFLSAFRDKPPTTTVCESRDGETVVRKVSGEDLEYWLKDYTLGELFASGQLESFE